MYNQEQNQGLFLFDPDQRDEETAKVLIAEIEATLVATIEAEVLSGTRPMWDSHPHLTSPVMRGLLQLQLIADMETFEVWGDSITREGLELIKEEPGLTQIGLPDA